MIPFVSNIINIPVSKVSTLSKKANFLLMLNNHSNFNDGCVYQIYGSGSGIKIIISFICRFNKHNKSNTQKEVILPFKNQNSNYIFKQEIWVKILII